MSTSVTPHQAAASCDRLRVMACDVDPALVDLKPTVPHCINFMLTHANKLTVHKSAVLALIVLCEKHNMPQFLAQNGLIPVLIATLATFVNDLALVKNVVLLARSLLVEPSNRSTFCQHAGFAALSSAMTAFPDRESIQCSASALIATICYENQSRRLLACSNRIVPLLLQVLARFQHPNHWKLQSNVCMALRNLSLEPAACEHILAKTHRLHAIVTVIKPTTNASAVEEALGVCLNIATASASQSSPLLHTVCPILTRCVVEFLAATPRCFRRNSTCHELSFAVLRVCEPLERRRAEERQRTEHMRLAILYAAAYASNRSESSVNVVSSSCLLIRTMVIDPTNRRLFGQLHRGIPTLVRSIAFLVRSPIHLEHALLALGNAVFDSPAGKLKACEWGAFRVIANAMNINTKNAAVAEAALITIHGLCIESEKVGNLATSLMFHHLCTQSMRHFETSSRIQEEGLSALLSMGSGPQAKKQLHASDAMQVAERAAGLYPYSKNILALSTKLKRLAANETQNDDNHRAALCERGSSLDRNRDIETHTAQDKQQSRDSLSVRIFGMMPSLQKLRSKPE
ncbi:unnamed protein product [Agarophyton chilense]